MALAADIINLRDAHIEIKLRYGHIHLPAAGGPASPFGLLLSMEAEEEITTHYEVYEKRPSDRDLLVSAIETHRQRLGCVPDLVAAHAGSTHPEARRRRTSWA